MADLIDLDLLNHLAGRGSHEQHRRVQAALDASPDLARRYDELAAVWRLPEQADVTLPQRDLWPELAGQIEAGRGRSSRSKTSQVDRRRPRAPVAEVGVFGLQVADSPADRRGVILDRLAVHGHVGRPRVRDRLKRRDFRCVDGREFRPLLSRGTETARRPGATTGRARTSRPRAGIVLPAGRPDGSTAQGTGQLDRRAGPSGRRPVAIP